MFNCNLDALRSAISYWGDQDWLTTDPTRPLRRRAVHRRQQRGDPAPAAPFGDGSDQTGRPVLTYSYMALHFNPYRRHPPTDRRRDDQSAIVQTNDGTESASSIAL